MLKKITKELERFKDRLFCSATKHKQLEEIQNRLGNMPYEIYEKIANGSIRVRMNNKNLTQELITN